MTNGTPTTTTTEWTDDGPEEQACCPGCGGEANLLGTLGTVDHFRCRACGLTFNEADWHELHDRMTHGLGVAS